MAQVRQTVVYLVLTMVLVGCGGSLRAPVTSSGQPLSVVFSLDAGITEGMTETQITHHNQLQEYMEVHMLRLLESVGYSASNIEDPSQFTPVQDGYLLTIQITDYNPGSGAARALVGFGAGACVLSTTYQLSEDGQTAIYSNSQSEGSGRSWQSLVQGIDALTARDITAFLSTH